MDERQDGPIDLPLEHEDIEMLEVQVRDHLKTPKDDECGYCGQAFPPDEIVIEREIHGMKWHFCSEDCYRDFLDASNFKDEDLDSKDAQPTLEAHTHLDEKEEEF